MKLVITQNALNEKGGAERVILKIAQRYDAKIYTLSYNKDGTFEEFKNIDVELLGKRLPLLNTLPSRVSNAVNYGYKFFTAKIPDEYDVINAHMSPSEWIRNRNPRVLWYCHTPPRELYDLKSVAVRKRSAKEQVLYNTLSVVYKSTEMRMLKYIEGIACNSEVTKQRLSKYLGVHDATVINPAIDAKRFYNGGDEKYFLYPSRISAQKRQDYAIEAFEKFVKASKLTNYKLVLAGSLTRGYKDFMDYYEKLKNMNVRNVVFKLNPSDDTLSELYAKCTAVLFSPINEDYGIVPLEGMASYKPVLSVNEGGPKETIINNKTGFLVSSPEQMAAKMKFVVDHPAISAKMGRGGRKRVEEHYSWNSFFKKFDAIARSVSKSM